ncbi:MAG: hypothetical protein AABW48_06345 [Nanoarchaeota archaeon]
MALTKTKLILGLLILLIVLQGTSAVTKTFRVQETDFVKINATAMDPDNDKVVYYYSPPLDEQGEWQTNYGDAGEYLIEITASDGLNQKEHEINLIVDKKNRAPGLIKSKIVVQEAQTVNLKELVQDPDEDSLIFVFNEPFDNQGQWKTDYADEGVYITNFKVSDGKFRIDLQVEIEVLNTLQPPSIVDSFSEAKTVQVKENQTLDFFVNVSNENAETLTYVWKFDGTTISKEEKGNHYLDFDTAGEHLLKVFVSDGTAGTSQEWRIKVEAVNRKPELSILPITVDEGEKIILDLPEVDSDGDMLTYSFNKIFNELGEWQTNFEDAGTYLVEVSAADGELKPTEEVKVVVNNVDRSPVLNVPELLEAKEGEELLWVIDAIDPDGTAVNITFKNLPEQAIFTPKTKTFSWKPSYDFIQRKGGLFSNVLNALRLENKFIKVIPSSLEVTACSKELCVTKTIPIYVYNVNQQPLLEKINNIAVTELETAVLNPVATDLDGDIVRVTFSEPFDGKGQWKTDYADEGKHLVYVAATDGELTTTIPVEVNVAKKNRMPKMDLKKDHHVINEGQELTFKVAATDLDDDELSIQVENLPAGATFEEGVFSWTPGFDTVKNANSGCTGWLVNKIENFNALLNKNEEVIQFEFTAFDGEFKVVHPVAITVKNVNQAPEIIDYLPLEKTTAKVGEKVIFHLAAVDENKDSLIYDWDFGLQEKDIHNTNTIERTFVSPGKKKVKVTVSDGFKEVEKEWVVNIVGEEMVKERKEKRWIKEEPVQDMKHVSESELVLEEPAETEEQESETPEEQEEQEEQELVEEQPTDSSAKFNVYVIRW